MAPPHNIDIDNHLDLIRTVASSMPRSKWLLSKAVYPSVLSEGWLAMWDALENFDPEKGNPHKTPEQQFRTYSSDYIKGRIIRWQEQACRLELLESCDHIEPRPPTPGDYMGITADPRQIHELLRLCQDKIDELPDQIRDVVIRVMAGKSVKQISVELGKSPAVISERKTIGFKKLNAWVRLARKTPPLPLRKGPIAEAEIEAKIRTLFPAVANLALQRQFEETMSIAGFELEKLIGTGGHAEVWLARKRGAAGHDRLVALKRLPPERADSDEAKRRFEEEVRTTSKLTHPNIVYYDTCVSDRGSLVLVMEYVDGQDLAQLMNERQFSRDAAVYLVEQVLLGLGHAHSRGIVHRDIKPSNILVSRDGTVKVLDFGIAQAEFTHLTPVRTGVTMGTSQWMSPEHEAGARVDERSDLFVVGRLLKALLLGRLDSKLKVFVRKLMRQAPDDRYQTAGEALAALPKCDHWRATSELAAHVRGEEIPGAVSATPLPASRRATVVIALLVALVLLLSGALVVQFWTGETQNPVVESVSEPAPAEEPVAEPDPAGEPASEPAPAALLTAQEEPQVQEPEPEPEPVKRERRRSRPTKRRRPFLTSPLPENPYLQYLTD